MAETTPTHVKFYREPLAEPWCKVGDRVITDFTGRITRHTVNSIEQSRCQGGWALFVSPVPRGSSGHGMSIDWFRPDIIEDVKL